LGSACFRVALFCSGSMMGRCGRIQMCKGTDKSCQSR
jgi:hypothetical protein